jgi:3-dehydro-L-gulonate 2-dehydrogenase
MAMSQFSYGMLESYRINGEQLPVAGGFDRAGQLTREPNAILESGRLLPIGYWKGSGLALLLDLLAALLSGGNATHQITPASLRETGLSQLFIAFDLSAIDQGSNSERMVNEIIDSVRGLNPLDDERVRYPGERTLEIRKQNLAQGIPVESRIWQHVQEM